MGGIATAITKYFQDFKVLRHTRSEYWGIQLINFLDSTTFFSVLTIAVILINEVLTHTDLPQVDTIELHNPAGSHGVFDDQQVLLSIRIAPSLPMVARHYLL